MLAVLSAWLALQLELVHDGPLTTVIGQIIFNFTEPVSSSRKWGHMVFLSIEWLLSVKCFCWFFKYFFWLCCMAYGILVPRSGIEPGQWQWKHRVRTTGPPGNSRVLSAY